MAGQHVAEGMGAVVGLAYALESTPNNLAHWFGAFPRATPKALRFKAGI